MVLVKRLQKDSNIVIDPPDFKEGHAKNIGGVVGLGRPRNPAHQIPPNPKNFLRHQLIGQNFLNMQEAARGETGCRPTICGSSARVLGGDGHGPFCLLGEAEKVF